jgi:hypothetical protein
MTRIRARALAPLAGVAFVGLVIAALAMPETPDATASGAKVKAFLAAHHTATRATDVLFAFAGLAALLFFASVAVYLRRKGSQILSSTTLAGGAITCASLLAAVGVQESMLDQHKRLSTDAAQALNLLSNNLFAPLLFGGMCVAVLSAGVAMLRTHSFPKAAGIVTTVVGAAYLTVVLAWFAFMATGLVTLYVAGYLFREYNRPDEVTLPEAPMSAQVPAQAIAETEQPTTA